MITLIHLFSLLQTGRFSLTQEMACQADIEGFLSAHLPPGCPCVREARLGPGERPDFLVASSIVIEVKINRANARDTQRQLERYARHEAVTGIILASNRAMVMPAAILGTPLMVLSLGRAWL